MLIYEGKLDYIDTNNTIDHRTQMQGLMSQSQVISFMNTLNIVKTTINDDLIKLCKPVVDQLNGFQKTGNVLMNQQVFLISLPLPLKIYANPQYKKVFINITNISELKSDDIYALFFYQLAYIKLFEIKKINEYNSHGIQIFLGNLINSLFQKRFGYSDDKKALEFVKIAIDAYVLKKFFGVNKGLYSKIKSGYPNLEIDHSKLVQLCVFIESREQTLSNTFMALNEIEVQKMDVNLIITQLSKFQSPELLQSFLSLDRFIGFMASLSTLKYNVISSTTVRYLKSNNTLSLIRWILNMIK